VLKLCAIGRRFPLSCDTSARLELAFSMAATQLEWRLASATVRLWLRLKEVQDFHAIAIAFILLSRHLDVLELREALPVSHLGRGPLQANGVRVPRFVRHKLVEVAQSVEKLWCKLPVERTHTRGNLRVPRPRLT
jgi:hypothetical protein